METRLHLNDYGLPRKQALTEANLNDILRLVQKEDLLVTISDELHNNAVLQQYINEDAAKLKKVKLSLKRKQSSDCAVSFEGKKNKNAQVHDTNAGQEEKMTVAYCDTGVVYSKHEQHTLVQRNEIENISFTESMDTDTDNQCVCTHPGESSVGETNKGEEDDCDNEKKKKVESKLLHVYEESLIRLKQFQKELEEFCQEGKRKVIGNYLEHAYNLCPRIANKNAACSLECKKDRMIEWCNEEINTFIRELATEATPRSIIISFLHHASFCKKNGRCNVPFCKELWKCMGELVLGNENPHGKKLNVMMSHLETVKKDDELTMGIDLKVLYQRRIGSGGFGDVFKSRVCLGKSEACMALKKMKHDEKQENLNMVDVAQVLQDVGKGPHLLMPDLILSSADDCFNLVVMELGKISLCEYIEKAVITHVNTCENPRSSSANNHFPHCNVALPLSTVCKFLLQIAKGIEYLHDRGYVHGDIKGDNIMIMVDSQQVKLCDFDFAKKEETKIQRGTKGYMAPEVIDKGGNYIKPSDVFSWSLLIAEMVFGRNMNYDGKWNYFVYKKYLSERNESYCLHIRQHCPELASLFERGTQMDYRNRPTIKQVIEYMKKNYKIRKYTEVNEPIKTYNDIGIKNPVVNIENLQLDKQSVLLSKEIMRKWMDMNLNKLPKHMVVREKIPVENDE